MKKAGLGFLLVSAILMLSPATVLAKTPPPLQVTKFQITSGGNQQNSPAIWGDNVIYSDWAAQGITLRLYNIQTKADTLLLSEPNHQLSGIIYGNTVIYSDFDGTQSDIYGLNLKTKKQFPIAVIAGSNQSNPAIFGDTVVWQDNRNGDSEIYGYNLNSKKEFQITNDLVNHYSPRIWQNKVVWYNTAPGGYYYIQGYDLTKKALFNIADLNNGYQQSPDIFANQVTWVESTGGQSKIDYEDLATGKVTSISGIGSVSWPQISRKYITYVDDENVGAHNIYVYDLANGTKTQVSNDGSQQASPTIPALWRNTAVWMSWITGNGDIYGAIIKK